jgi:cyclic pyranopterin phosphate synthase
MVNVSGKAVTRRVATAKGIIRLGPIITEAIVNQALKKGDALAVARIAGIMAAKNTSRAIPLCHPLFLTGCDVELRVLGESHSLEAVCTVSTDGTTGVEMEALNGVSGALLTVYDMAKALDKGMVIGPVWLVEKSGGKSGTYRAGPGTPST